MYPLLPISLERIKIHPLIVLIIMHGWYPPDLFTTNLEWVDNDRGGGYLCLSISNVPKEPFRSAPEFGRNQKEMRVVFDIRRHIWEHCAYCGICVSSSFQGK